MKTKLRPKNLSVAALIKERDEKKAESLNLESTEEETPITEKIGTFEARHEWVPVFFTASWMVRIFVNGKQVEESEGKDNQWDPSEIEYFVRKYLRTNSQFLKSEGINIIKEFFNWSNYHSYPTNIS